MLLFFANLSAHPHGWYFFFLLPLTRLSVFLRCRIQISQQLILFSILRLFSYISLSRQVHSTKSVASSSTFLSRIFIRHTLHPLHQSVNLLSGPVFLLLFCQIFPFHLFCNNYTNKPFSLIATYKMIYSFFMMSTRQNISNFARYTMPRRKMQLSVLTSYCTKHNFRSKMRRLFMQKCLYLYVYSTPP